MTGGGTAGVLQDEGDRNENEQPVDGWFRRHRSGSLQCGSWLVHPADDSEKESCRPAAHQDAGERFDAADQAPLVRQDQVSVARRCVSHCAEIEGRWEIRHAVIPRVEKSPNRDLNQMQENDPSGSADEHPGRRPEAPAYSRDRLAQPAQQRRHTHGVDRYAQRHQRPGDEKFREHASGSDCMSGTRDVDRILDLLAGNGSLDCAVK